MKILFTIATIVFCAAQSVSASAYFNQDAKMSESQTEEMKEQYRQAARELGKLAGEFRSFYTELKQTVQEEGLLEFDDEGGFGSVDIVESANSLSVTVDLPGVDKKSINIELEENKTLLLSAERSAPSVSKQENMKKSERFSGNFKKSIKLPGIVEAEGIEAKYTNGVLNITLQKVEKSHESIKIQVQ